MGETETTAATKMAELVLATTTSTQDSGLLDVIIPAFEAAYDHQIEVKVIAVGTGQALQLGCDGNADVLKKKILPILMRLGQEKFGEALFVPDAKKR
jgi:ABC-type tungstate transport system permease subunit